MHIFDIGFVGGALILAGYVLHLNLWRAILFVKPGTILVDVDAPADQMKLPDALAGFARRLGDLGFVPLASRIEKPYFAPATVSYDYLHAADKTFATLYIGRDGRPRLYFLSATEPDGFVITANYRRPAREIPGRYLSSGVEDMPPDRLYRAHRRRLEG